MKTIEINITMHDGSHFKTDAPLSRVRFLSDFVHQEIENARNEFDIRNLYIGEDIFTKIEVEIK